MDLLKFKRVDELISTTKWVALCCCTLMAVSFLVSSLLLYSKIDQLSEKVLVLDTSGKVYDTQLYNTPEMRRFEYEDHIRTFVSKWYAIDEGTYKSNIESALHLIGNNGKRLLDDYNDLNMYNTLVQKNISYSVAIEELHINMSTMPISGEVKFLQTGYRARGSISRLIHARFTLYDVSRTRNNSHGAKIEDWEVKYYDPNPVNKADYEE